MKRGEKLTRSEETEEENKIKQRMRDNVLFFYSPNKPQNDK